MREEKKSEESRKDEKRAKSRLCGSQCRRHDVGTVQMTHDMTQHPMKAHIGTGMHTSNWHMHECATLCTNTLPQTNTEMSVVKERVC